MYMFDSESTNQSQLVVYNWTNERTQQYYKHSFFLVGVLEKNLI